MLLVMRYIGRVGGRFCLLFVTCGSRMGYMGGMPGVLLHVEVGGRFCYKLLEKCVIKGLNISTACYTLYVLGGSGCHVLTEKHYCYLIKG